MSFHEGSAWQEWLEREEQRRKTKSKPPPMTRRHIWTRVPGMTTTHQGPTRYCAECGVFETLDYTKRCIPRKEVMPREDTYAELQKVITEFEEAKNDLNRYEISAEQKRDRIKNLKKRILELKKEHDEALQMLMDTVS